MNKRWNILAGHNEKDKALSQSLKINNTLCKILVQRGIDDFEKSKAFFRPQLKDLHDPFLMKDMEIAVQRIQKAIATKENYTIENGLVIIDRKFAKEDQIQIEFLFSTLK
jgi:single-stranded-DNA-specific exonuclease